MSDPSEYYLAGRKDVIEFETLEVSHPAFSRTYWIVRNARGGLVATIETGAEVTFEYYPLRITQARAANALDYGARIDLGDLGELIPDEMDRVRAAGLMSTKPQVVYRTFRSDDLSAPLFGPVRLEAGPITLAATGASFEARAPSLYLGRTGTTYSLTDFPMMRGFLQ